MGLRFRTSSAERISAFGAQADATKESHAHIPHIVRVINYEDMVTDPAAALRTAAELCGLPAPQGVLPAVGDDRDCAEPYRQFMQAA